MRIARDERGATGPEYVGVVLLIALVIGAVWRLEVASEVREWGTYAVCGLFGDGCDRPAGRATTDEPVLAQPPVPASRTPDALLRDLETVPSHPPVCMVDSTEHRHRSTADLLLHRSVSGTRFVTSELSDGTVVIVETQEQGSGWVVGAGGELPLGSSQSLNVSGTGAAVEVHETGLVYELGPDDYLAYRDERVQQAIDAYVHGRPELRIMDEVLGAGSAQDAASIQVYGGVVLDELRDRVESYATHDLYRTSGEVSLSLGASWKLLSGSITVEGSTGSTLQVHRETGERQVTIHLDGSTSAALGAGVLGVGASGGGTQVAGSAVTVTFDADGEIVAASTSLSFEVAANGFVGFDLAGLPGAPSGTSVGADWEAGLGWGGQRGAMAQLTFDLPLDSPTAQDQLDRLLRDPAREGPAALGTALGQGSALLEVYEVGGSNESSGAALRALFSLGAADERSTRQLNLVHAVSYDPVHGLLQRGECSR